MGQKSTYTEWHGEMICAGLAEGNSLLSICEALGISYEAARNWERDIPEHGTNSARARELGCHYLAEQCLEIADDSRNDWVERHGSDGEPAGSAFNTEHFQRSKLRIDTRMRLIGKWLPKVYGERTTLVGDPDAPLHVKRSAADMTDDELAQIAAGRKPIGG